MEAERVNFESMFVRDKNDIKMFVGEALLSVPRSTRNLKSSTVCECLDRTLNLSGHLMLADNRSSEPRERLE